jgi:hypothetical protein
MLHNKGIPTIGARGIQFRSRIEALWAYIFEKLHWDWEYEPIDLDGYIPDFIIKFGEDEILIEIKGDMNIWRKEVYEPHKEKIIASGWKGKFGILGSVYETNYHGNDIIINIGKYFPEIGIDDVPDGLLLITKQENVRSAKKHSFYLTGILSDNSWYCDLGDGYWKDITDTYEAFSQIWVEAKNSVQWKGKQNTFSQIKLKENKKVVVPYVSTSRQLCSLSELPDLTYLSYIGDITSNNDKKIYTCKKCGKGYNTKKQYEDHEKNCDCLDVLTCPKCMIHFAHRNGKSRHIKANTCKARSIIHSNIHDVLLANQYHRIINNKYIHNYGQERMDYIDHEKYIHIFSQNYDIPSAMIKEIHFNKYFPENQNIQYHNNKNAIVKSNNEYTYKSLRPFVEEIIKDKTHMVQTYAINNKDDICNRMGEELYEEIMELSLKLMLLKKPFRQYTRQVNNIIDMVMNSHILQLPP